MRLPQFQRPIQAAVMAAGFRPVLARFTLRIRPTLPMAQSLRGGDGGVDGRRYASVKSQGAYRIPNKKTIMKKLGAKRSGDQFVIPGNIIFKQRGTMWHAGFNAIRGRDHTIHAAATGYVKYYRDPARHPDKQYIGVAFNKEDTLPYPASEPRRRKLNMIAHVRKAGAGPRPRLSNSGIPHRVLRKAGLYNIQALERRLWNADKRAEMKEAARLRAKAARAGRAGVPPEAVSPLFAAGAHAPTASAAAHPAAKAPTDAGAHRPAVVPTTPVEAPPAVVDSADVTSPDAFAAAAISRAPAHAPAKGTRATAPPIATRKAIRVSAGHPGRPQSTKTVTAAEFLQKSWQERRRTKVLLLNPRTYAYAESNAAIGRLSSKTMYTPPWKLGGRKARFRTRRKRRVAKIAKKKADKELVRAEKEKERVAAEKKRAERLEKQRARARKAEEQQAAAAAATAAAAAVVVQAADGAAPVDAQARARPMEAKEIEKPVTIQESTRPVAAKATETPLEIQETAQPVEARDTENTAEIEASAQPIDAEASSHPAAQAKLAENVTTNEEEKPVEAKEPERSTTDTKQSDKPVEP